MSRKIIRWLMVILAIWVLLAGTFLLAQAAPLPDAANGEMLFKAKCASCHTIGGGKLVGPDLKGVTLLRDAAWLAAWIKAPEEVLAAGDPIATQLLAENNNLVMPNLALNDTEVADLIAYIQSLDNPPTAAPDQPESAPSDAPAPEPFTTLQVVLMLNGDAQYGEKLFTGAAPLQNGGTHCMACHNVEGIGIIGGGTLGLDLTHVYTKYGRKGLASALGTLPFPTMQGVFANKLLTDTEQADLLAFFEKADQGGQPQQNLLFLLAGGSGLVVFLLAGMFYFWPRQRMGIAQRLRKNGKL